MLNVKRRRTKKRLYYITAFLAVAIIISLAIIIRGCSSDAGGISVVQQSEAPLTPESDGKFIVCLDPGHGGKYTGAESVLDFYEKDINLKVALMVGEILKDDDMEIVLTRTTDKVLGTNLEEDLKARCEISNNALADIFISIHCNYDKVSDSTAGIEVWCRYSGQDGEKLATCLDEQLAKLNYTRDRGLKYEEDGSLYVLRNTNAPAALVELGFLNNVSDSTFLKSEEGQKKCSEAIAQGLRDYVNRQSSDQLNETEESK